MTEKLSIKIKNCNSIAEATIELNKGSLNIKYGPNGIGKSTIAKALALHAEGGTSLEKLRPFKYRGAQSDSSVDAPTVAGADDIKSVLVFDDTYVSTFVFQQDEVLKNSFEIFINTDEYKQGLKAIDSRFDALKLSVTAGAEFQEAMLALSTLRDAFSLTKAGVVSRASKGYKALSVGGKLSSVPPEFQGYASFLQSERPADWITWQSRGQGFLELSDHCPYCASDHVDKAHVVKVSQEYESSLVKTMSVISLAIAQIGEWIAPADLDKLKELTGLVTELSEEQATFLATLRMEVDTLLTKLTALREVSFHRLRDAPNVGEALGALKIDLGLLGHLTSPKTQGVVDPINAQLDDVARELTEIQKSVGQQKSRVKDLIGSNQTSINNFLKSAGYRYKVHIEEKQESYRMILEHDDMRGHLEEASSHLSYGEKNAFAMVLFMHHVLRDRPSLVVLDDPVSSFDKTKKFAILHRLFNDPTGLRGFTTLLLTHDVEPVIDIVKSATSVQFNNVSPAAHFLASSNGVVNERMITKADVQPFSAICDVNVASSADDVIKCIYLRRRYELHGDLGAVYDVLSSLLHARVVPTSKNEDGASVELDASAIADATRLIQQDFPTFDYKTIFDVVSDAAEMERRYNGTNVGYEKVQLFRVMAQSADGKLQGTSAFKKFINESYHIENEYVMQLNPQKFDAVPEAIVEMCTSFVRSLREGGLSDVVVVDAK